MKTLCRSIFAAWLFALGGCAHPPPRAIVLPTTAAVRKPLVAAQAHVARAVEIGHQEAALVAAAVGKGIAAGSPEAKQLSSLVAADQAEKSASQDQLTAALYQTGTLQHELDAKQAQFDAVEKDDAAKTKQVGSLRKSVFHWRTALLVLFALDFFIGGLIQSALRSAVATVGRVALSFAKHLAAFWPILLAAL